VRGGWQLRIAGRAAPNADCMFGDCFATKSVTTAFIFFAGGGPGRFDFCSVAAWRPETFAISVINLIARNG